MQISQSAKPSYLPRHAEATSPTHLRLAPARSPQVTREAYLPHATRAAILSLLETSCYFSSHPGHREVALATQRHTAILTTLLNSFWADWTPPWNRQSERKNQDSPKDRVLGAGWGQGQVSTCYTGDELSDPLRLWSWEVERLGPACRGHRRVASSTGRGDPDTFLPDLCASVYPPGWPLSCGALFSPVEEPGHWETAGLDLDPGGHRIPGSLWPAGRNALKGSGGGRWPQQAGLRPCPPPWSSEWLGTWHSWTRHAWRPWPTPAPLWAVFAFSCGTGWLLVLGTADPATPTQLIPFQRQEGKREFLTANSYTNWSR